VIHTAHEQGIVHRDIKPANVMVLSRAGRLLPKLLDFGVAKTVEEVPQDTPSQEGRLGTPIYMAPELWVDPAAADARADLYALGVTLVQPSTMCSAPMTTLPAIQRSATRTRPGS
jgi:serine/threonine-protein kinase